VSFEYDFILSFSGMLHIIY